MESTGQDNAYRHDMRVEYARGARDALRAVNDYLRCVDNPAAQATVGEVAKAIADEFGVEL